MPSSARSESVRASARPRLRRTRLTTAALAVILAAAGPAEAGSPASAAAENAATARTASTAATAVNHAADDTAASSYDLTLVTGDIVHVTVHSDGKKSAEVSPAPRPDASSPSFWTHERDGELHVIPDDVASLIPGRLDPALFNVDALIDQRDAETHGDDLGVIITYQPGAKMRTQAAPSGDAVRLESVNGLGVHIDGDDDTGAILEALHQLADQPQARTLSSGPYTGIDKIWLDRPIEPALDESVPRIGAPTAWQQGLDGSGVTVAVLDTGIDTDHPDLAHNVVTARNFTDSDTTDDRAGHGTHVASTIAGSGAASDGQYTGVAPGVELINAKVIGDGGTGTTADMIEAMEWVAQQGADIVNMSIGVRGDYSDGTDPGSLAVDALTEQYDVLFVISAGNDGPRESTVTTPATANLALTVANVDKQGQIAESSSRGPRAGDRALKPDISAPGVHIGAARADGTALCQLTCTQPGDGPIDDYYTSASGTSMAAPHVTGAAALVAHKYPELDAMQLKAWLMQTATENDELSIYAEGAGEVNVPRALDEPLLAAPASVGFGDFGYPHAQRDPVERSVTYTNPGDETQTLTLTVDTENADGEPTPEGALTLSTPTLTVPAGGTATVTLTLDTAQAGAGQFGGALIAQTADGASLRTPVGYYTEPEMYDLHVEGVARDGREAYGRFSVLDVVDGSVNAVRAWGQGDDTSCTTVEQVTSNCVRVPPGTYSISGLIATMPPYAEAGRAPGPLDAYLNTSLVSEPEVTIDSTTTLTLDARNAVEVQIDTPDHETKRNDGAARELKLARVPDEGPIADVGLLITPRTQLEEKLYVQPTEPVTHGDLMAYTHWELAAPAITFDVVGADDVQLDPLYYDWGWFGNDSRTFPMLSGEHELKVVDAGTASPAEIDGLDLDGALALIRRSDAIPVPEQSNNAAEAGAAMVAIYNDEPGPNANPGQPGLVQVPTVRLSHAEGRALLDLLAQRQVTVTAEGRPVSPYRYNLAFTENGHIPAELHYVADSDQLAAVENSFHGQLGEDLTFSEAWYAVPAWQNYGLSFGFPTRGGPQTRTDYYVPDPGLEYRSSVSTPETAPWPEPRLTFEGQRRSLRAGERVQQSWFNAVMHPGPWPTDPIRRSGDLMNFNLAAVIDGDYHPASASTTPLDLPGFTTRFQVFAEDEQIIDSPVTAGSIAVSPEAETFRIEYDVANAAPWANLSTSSRSVWTFTSASTPEDQVRVEPLLTLDYDVDVDLQNRMPSPSQSNGPHTVEFTVGHQDGAPDLPIRSTASLEVSYDSGETWRKIRNLREVEDGHFVATLPRQAPAGGDGFVSLRVRAEDRGGNTVEQEIIRAYALG